jgi:hypothetical protein
MIRPKEIYKLDFLEYTMALIDVLLTQDIGVSQT